MPIVDRLRDALLELRVRLRRLRAPARTQSQLHDFWLDPTARNEPEDYVREEFRPRSEFLLQLIRLHTEIDDQASLLEVGCNAGRNLSHLFDAGLRTLSAVELNPRAIEVLRKTFPKLGERLDVRVGPAERELPRFADREFDVVFTMAVLEHIHDDAASVFEEIARVCGRFLITIEDERKVSWRHFPRNYRRVFEPLGFRQIHVERCDKARHAISKVHFARVFERLET